MSIYKQLKDSLIRAVWGKNLVPTGLYELQRYFRLNGPINFRSEKQEDGSIVVISENFQHGTIITRVTTKEELDDKIIDAILTAFEIPSSYAKEADVRRKDAHVYAVA